MYRNRLIALFLVTAIATALLAACASPTPTMLAPAPTMAAVATQVAEVEVTGVTSLDVSPARVPPPAGQMIIKNADIEVLVADTNVALDQVTLMAGDFGGYLISSQTWFDGDYQHGTLNMGVPAAQFEAVLNRLRHVGSKVLRETTSGQDVSADYADLQARLTNLEATSARVREFLTSATNVTESLAINSELSSLEGQIEQIKGQMRYYEGRSAYSTITVTLTPERAPVEPRPAPAWKPGETFESAVKVLTSASQSAADGLIWFTIVCGPGLLLLAIALGAVRLLRRRTRK